MNLFPYTNFHDLNLDWLLQQLRKAVFKVNGTEPDEDGNVNLPGVSGVSSVNGIGADGSGNVQITAVNVNAVPVSSLHTTTVQIRPTSNLHPGSYGTCIKNSFMSVVNMVAWFEDTLDDYVTVGDLVKIPIFTVAGNLFGYEAESIVNTPADDNHQFGISSISQDQGTINWAGIKVFAFYNGTDTVFYVVKTDAMEMPSTGVIVNQLTKLL